MTDKEKLEALLTEFGVGFVHEHPYLGSDDNSNLIYCTAGHDKIDGYCMFFTTFEFNDDGSFKQMGAWE